jgi:hypothetical protein
VGISTRPRRKPAAAPPEFEGEVVAECGRSEVPRCRAGRTWCRPPRPTAIVDTTTLSSPGAHPSERLRALGSRALPQPGPAVVGARHAPFQRPISFGRALRIVRRHVTDQAAFPPSWPPRAPAEALGETRERNAPYLPAGCAPTPAPRRQTQGGQLDTQTRRAPQSAPAGHSPRDAGRPDQDQIHSSPEKYLNHRYCIQP